MIARGIVLQPENSIDIEPDALTLYDLSRYRNHGTMLGVGEPDAVQLPSGLWVWEYDGANDNISIPDHASLNFTGSFTLEAWIRPTAIGAFMRIFSKNNGANGYEYFVANTGAIWMTTTIGGANVITQTPAASLVIDTWYHIVATREDNTGRIYRNGIDITSVFPFHIDHGIYAGAARIGIYTDGVTAPFEGRISFRKVRNYALTAGQVLNCFENEKHWYGVHD